MESKKIKMFKIAHLGIEPFDNQEENITGSRLIELLQSKLVDHPTPIALKINGRVCDLTTLLPEGAEIEFVSKESSQGLEIIRHSAAHVLAQAVKDLFPGVQVTIGPVIEDGFYYDFYSETPFKPQDLEAITERMKKIIDFDQTTIRHVWTRQHTIDFFEARGEKFKVEIIKAIPENEPLSIYQQGNFFDVCRGPHVSSTSVLGKAFALTKISGSYWRGDSKNTPLQRIYGTAWATQEDLAAYFHRIEEAEKRDHRKLGHQMDLFHFQEEAPGSIFWHASGWTIYHELQSYIRRMLDHHGYQEVNTPQLVSKTLWEASGHWQKFRDNMYAIDHEEQVYALKPMNCPCHVQIFNHSLKSYRDLPLRMAEFGRCMRHEPSGSRSGLMRVVSFVQDDAHIFCTPEQLVEETTAFCNLLFLVYRHLGFDDVIVRFSTRPENRLGTDEVWDHAEESLKKGADAAGLSYSVFPGEGAFYGPKLEFVLKDSLGREWQCGTLQVDFILPQRLEASYVGCDGKKHAPVILHRAILGSFERFIGVLLEHTGGHLPLWITPVQAVIISVSEKFSDYGQSIARALSPLRVHVDDRSEKMGYKIREHTLKKVPYLIVVGAKEVDTQTVTVRYKNENQTLSLQELEERLKNEARAPDISLLS